MLGGSFSLGKLTFDTVGGETFDRSLECVAVNGRMATIVANESTRISQTLFRKNATLHYEFMGVPAIHGLGRDGQAEILVRAAELVDLDGDGQLDLVRAVLE